MMLDLRELKTRPRVMGILNVTGDSFYDGGRYQSLDAALEQAARMISDGADYIDVGGESTRPGAEPISAELECERVIPVIDALHREFSIPISIDTSKPMVMREAVRCGASLINDVFALRAEGALATAAELAVPICLMHMQGEPRTMQANPYYDNVVTSVSTFFEERIALCEQAGIPRSRLILDPGFGFGKTVQHNLTLIRELQSFQAFGLPLLMGISRKSSIGVVLNQPPEQRLIGSITLAVMAAMQGVSILRCHDVKETVDAMHMVYAVMKEERN